MIKLLKRLIEWLETRFPPKVVVTEKSYQEICKSLDNTDSVVKTMVVTIERADEMCKKLSSRIDDINSMAVSAITFESRISAIEDSISALKEGIVKGEIRPALTERERERQEFINGALPRNMPSRRELEAAERK